MKTACFRTVLVALRRLETAEERERRLQVERERRRRRRLNESSMAQEGRLPRGSITLYWSEIWSITETELLMLERVHSKILCTIQGLPTRCPLSALRNLLGSRSLSSFISHRQQAFVNSITIMDSSALHPEASGTLGQLQPDFWLHPGVQP